MSWIHTRHGRAFDLLDPQVDQVSLADVAHGLAHVCRYTGHSRRHYSVAEHSVYVAQRVFQETRDVDLAFAGLMHDAHEVYVGDVAQPIKVAMRGGGALRSAFDDLERRVEHVVRRALGAPEVMPEVVKVVDLRMLATEAPQVLSWPPPRGWDFPAWASAYSDLQLEFWPADLAASRFLAAVWMFGPTADVRMHARALMGETIAAAAESAA